MSDRRGFTLIELLISISIFAMMTGFLMANFRSGRTADELRIGAQNAGSVLREAQNMAVTGRVVSVCRGGASDLHVCVDGNASSCLGGTCTAELPRGYGVRLTTAAGNATMAVLFADTDGDRAFDNGETMNERVLSPSSRVTVKAVTPSNAGVLDVVFEPPKPSVFFNAATTETTATVTLEHSTSLATRVVSINRVSGQISID